MPSSRFHVSAALLLALALAGSLADGAAAQQDAVRIPQGQGEPMRMPPGQGDSGRKAPDPAPAADRATTAQAAPDDDDSKDLERARAAARAADPRLQGLEKAREAARKAQDQGGAKGCLSAREARDAILAKKAVTLSQALHAARSAWNGEVIDYKLCTFDGTLAYDLTLLNGEGRVARVRVGASDGKLVNVR